MFYKVIVSLFLVLSLVLQGCAGGEKKEDKTLESQIKNDQQLIELKSRIGEKAKKSKEQVLDTLIDKVSE
ncbi:MAG: hypothetical protein LBH40_01785 [Alphaproteobacteria bacterium]|nr:hypothetical protein [Alphaproteobacteria bacterium]